VCKGDVPPSPGRRDRTTKRIGFGRKPSAECHRTGDGELAERKTFPARSDDRRSMTNFRAYL